MNSQNKPNQLATPPRPSGHATMNDVAHHAGVSLKSVSRVINNEPHVSPKLRARVELAIAALKYAPDTAARSLAGARSFELAVLLDNPSPNYTVKVLAGAYRACLKWSYHLRVVNLETRVDHEMLLDQLDAMLRNSRADGFVLTPPMSDNPAVLDFLESRNARYSRIAPILDQGRAPDVLIDDAAAAAEVADMFLRFGHRRIAIVNGPRDHGAAGTRRAGFMGRLKECAPSAIVSEADGEFLFAGGIEAGRELLSARRYPTAIFATNDDMAAGVMVACAELGLKVPADVSVCGFDDSWVAMSVWPYLTTVHQPIEELSEAAALSLLERSSADVPKLRRLDFHLIERGSVGPAP